MVLVGDPAESAVREIAAKLPPSVELVHTPGITEIHNAFGVREFPVVLKVVDGLVASSTSRVPGDHRSAESVTT